MRGVTSRGDRTSAGRGRALTRRAGALATLAACALATSAPPGAELYRCQDASGHVRFTNDPAACPGADPHEPEAAIQHIQAPRSRPAPSSVPPGGPASTDPLAGQEATWRAKLQQARAEREGLGAEVAQLRQIVAWCNRGGGVAQKDETGLRHRVKCSAVRHDYQQKQARLDALESYLREGIHEECRRAGCLPGWLR